MRLLGSTLGCAAVAATGVAVARPHEPAPPLPAPAGAVVAVASVEELENAVRRVTSGTTILIQPGTYALRNTLYVTGGVENVALRGASPRRTDVVLVGQGMDKPSAGVPHGILLGDARNVTIANLTIRDVQYHCVAMQGQEGCRGPRLYNLRLLDAGEQHVKASPAKSAGQGVDAGIVEYCSIEYTTTCADDYCNGVDVHAGKGWTIRHNLFRNIRGHPKVGPGGPAILMWNRSRDTVVEGNLFLNCERGIAFGLNASVGDDHAGGVIRNNIFHRGPDQSGDAAVIVWNSAGTHVLHNTLILSGTYPDAVDYRFAATTGVEVANNLTDGRINARDGATGALAGNVTGVRPEWFANVAMEDFHLAPSAPADRLQVAPRKDVGDDWDGQPRPEGGVAEAGADEVSKKKPVNERAKAPPARLKTK